MAVQGPVLLAELAHCQLTVWPASLSGSSSLAVRGVRACGGSGGRLTVPASFRSVTVDGHWNIESSVPASFPFSSWPSSTDTTTS